MGNILFSELFDQENTASTDESVINLSDNCISMLLNDVSNENTEPAPPATDGEQDDWIQKLKTLDDVHSTANGLTVPAVEALLSKVESQVEKIRPQSCSTYWLLLCLQKNENCMIKCKQLIDEFIDCVDKSRIDIVKERIEAEDKIEDAPLNELREFVSDKN